MKTNRRTFLGGLSTAALLPPAGPSLARGDKKYSEGATDTEIRIGHTNPYSGPASAYGTIGRTISAYFKKVNDEGGHVFGDHVLAMTARALVEHTRESDVVARYGGEEFAVVLPKTGIQVARPIAERIRTTLAARKIIRRNTGEGLGGITISIGAADRKSTRLNSSH